MIDLKRTIKNLSRHRRIFYSTDDLKRALITCLHEDYPSSFICSDYRPFKKGTRYIGVWEEQHGPPTAIHLRYPTGKIEWIENNEEFKLKRHGANDQHRYDFLGDIARLEKFAKEIPGAVGHAVLLTNDSLYWRVTTNWTKTIDAAFRFHEGQHISGTFEWSENAGPGSTKGREKSIFLKYKYTANWQDYSELGAEKNEIFKFLLFDVH